MNEKELVEQLEKIFEQTKLQNRLSYHILWIQFMNAKKSVKEQLVSEIKELWDKIEGEQE